MKTRMLLLIGVGLLFAVRLFAADSLPQTPQELLVAYQKAIQTGDETRLMALHQWDLENPKVVAGRERAVKLKIQYQKGLKYSLVPWEATDGFPIVMQGQKMDFMALPEGGLKVGDESGGIVTPYARIDGGYKLVGQRRTDLKWTGPADEMLGFWVSSGDPKSKDASLKLLLRYSASGIILERPLTVKVADESNSFGAWGQKIEEVIVLENTGPERTFEIKRGDEQKLVFKGTIPAGVTGSVYKAEK